MMSPQYLTEITSPTSTSQQQQQQQRKGDDTIHTHASGHAEVEVEYMTEEEEIVAKEEAILVWLWTFPQVSNAVKNEEKWSLITELDHLKDIDVAKIGDFEAALLSYVHAEHGELMSQIVESGDYNDDIANTFKSAIETFKSTQTW